jgi:lipid A 3-O-deacylase
MTFTRLSIALLSWICAAGSSVAADLPPTTAAAPAPAAEAYDPNRFEVRGGFLASTWKPRIGDPYANVEIVLPKLMSVPGWQDLLLPRLHAGAMGNLAGRTSYVYAGGLWTLNYDRYFAEALFGGAVHNGPLISAKPDEPSVGCRWAYHSGANLGYRFNAHWSAMLTFDHLSNGRPTLSSCPAKTGLSELGVRVGYSF